MFVLLDDQGWLKKAERGARYQEGIDYLSTTALKKLKYTVSAALQEAFLSEIIDSFGSDVYFVQVGANDGKMNDPLHKIIKEHHWHGLLFEPVPALFLELQANYSDHAELTLVQAACGDIESELPFYQLRSLSDLPFEWMRGLSSFNRDVIRKHFKSDEQFSQFVEQVNIPIRPLNRYLEEYDFRRCDILLVDTEGFEIKVMNGLDLRKYRPVLIIAEHQHLSLADKSYLHEVLHKAGYTRSIGYFDTFFFRSEYFSLDHLSIFRGFENPVVADKW